MAVPKTSAEMLKLEDAVRYPGAARKSALITLGSVAVMIVGSFLLHDVWVPVVVGMACMMGGVVIVVLRGNDLMAVATRISRDHPEYTPRQAANAARKELGLREVRYP
jgi:hypothetical protein